MVVLVGCSPKVTEGDLQNLNGYWEIKEVSFPNGDTKDFRSSTTIDYIELDGMKGFRKKVQPKFNGTFETSNDAELFTILQNENHFELNYTGSTDSWTEEIISISKDNFSVINQDTLTYSYKRYEPLNLNQ
jgi:hypothetical protein